MNQDQDQDHTKEFQQARIEALTAYANLEYAIADVLDAALCSSTEFAGHIVLFKITNTRTRYAIIDEFIGNSFPAYHKAWRVLQKWLGEIDETRNALVHWTVFYKQTYKDGRFVLGPVRLHNPKSMSVDGRPISIARIRRFHESCKTMSRIFFSFAFCLAPEEGPYQPLPEPWRDKFLQLTNRQTPKALLSRLIRATRQRQPQSSGA
jgi:hypothetical protein